MDSRRQHQDDDTMPFSVAYNPPIRESSSKLLSSSSSAAALFVPGGGERGPRSGNGNAPPPLNDDQPPPPLPRDAFRYRECLKNHAATIGSHVLDGCGEFMPGGSEGTLEALKCAACECHRNFHRKEVAGEESTHLAPCHYYYHGGGGDLKGGVRSRAPPLPLPVRPTAAVVGPIPAMMVTLGGGSGATESSSDELTAFQSNAAAAAVHSLQHPPAPFAVSKKRFRTKFTQEQKDMMLEFAEKVGWKTRKQDEAAVEEFCAQVGVKRQVLKVWMHNNKHAMKNKQS